MDLADILDYFQRSSFEYLALDSDGRSLRLQRAVAPAVAVMAPGVGTVVVLPSTVRLPRPGDRVARGHPLFAVRRFRTLIEVSAPCDGEIASVDVVAGQFVEFGQTLAHIRS